MLTKIVSNYRKYNQLLIELVKKDIKNKYRKSTIGFFWSLLNPLLMMTIISIVFINLFKFNVENYPIYILSGQVCFNFFLETTTVGMRAIIDNDTLLKKVYVPRYIFVLSQSVTSLINLFASFIALYIVMLVLRVDLHFMSFLFVVPIILLYIFSLGVAIFLSALAVKFRDCMYLWGVITTGLFYMTPVIYPISLMEGKKVGILVLLNPITNYLTMFRNVMINNTFFSPKSLIVGIVEAALVLVLGISFFYKRQDTFILDL